MFYDIVPCPKPRMTRADRWKQRPSVVRYRAFCDEVRAAGVVLPEDGATVVFYLPMPKSWSKKKRSQMLGSLHKQVPDLDNLIKGICDALYQDDSCVSSFGRVEKRWADKGGIFITVCEEV